MGSGVRVGAIWARVVNPSTSDSPPAVAVAVGAENDGSIVYMGDAIGLVDGDVVVPLLAQADIITMATTTRGKTDVRVIYLSFKIMLTILADILIIFIISYTLVCSMNVVNTVRTYADR